MSRLPFDPDRVAAPKDAASQAGRAAEGSAKPSPVTVTGLAALIKDALSQAMPARVHVVGEISNLSRRTHLFFSLKDAAASIRCVSFQSAVRKLDFTPEDGQQVIASGRVDFYDAQGNIQLYIDRMELAGAGALEAKLKALMRELRDEGYFDPATKLPLPVMTKRLAVVTSANGAAMQDVIDTARRRWAGCELLLYDVRVQGADAAPQIARAIDRLSRFGPSLGIDAVLVTRGGGSLEDLWAFNERIVADAIHVCPLPIVCAIGHETDTTIAELVADARCATPTQAAMTLVPDAAALRQQVDQTWRRLDGHLRRLLRGQRDRLESLARRPALRRPGRMLDPLRSRLDQLERRLVASGQRRVQDARRRLAFLASRPLLRDPAAQIAPHRDRLAQATQRLRQATQRRLAAEGDRLDGLQRELDAVGPANVLARGFSYTLTASGALVRDAAAAHPGDRLITVLHRGRIHSTVDADNAARGSSTPATPAPDRSAAAPRRRRSRSKPGQDPGPTLFDGG